MALVGDAVGAAKGRDDERAIGHGAVPKIVQNIQNDGRDISDLWNAALKSYKGVVGFDLTPRAANLEELRAIGVADLQRLQTSRHDGGKVDRLRSLFSKHFDLLDKGFQQLAAVTSSAFPPAAAIGTAVTWMLSACSKVSREYDALELFFSDMNSFLERVDILEKRMPKENGLRNCLMEVFSSFLRIWGLATEFIKNGRFKKWITNLMQGDDSELDKARKGLVQKLANLHEAIAFSILANVDDLKTMSEELLRNSEDHSRVLADQTNMLHDILAGQHTLKTEFAKLFKALESARQDDSTRGQSKAPGGPAGRSKAASASRIRSRLPTVDGDMTEYHILEETIVDGTCTWLFSQPEWLAWAGEGDEGSGDASPKLLAITGEPGSGKSHIAATVYDHLEQRAGDAEFERRLCAVHFYFREQKPSLARFLNAVITAINQVAEQNPTLCERIYSQVVRDNVNVDYEDWRSLLHNLLRPCFEEDTRYRLFIVLDGIDELDDVERLYLDEFWGHIVAANLRISLVVTSRPDGFQLTCGEDERSFAGTIHITREHQKSDLAAIVRNHLGNLDPMKRFSPAVKQQISEKIEANAPNLLYAQHMLRYFNAIGREGAVLGQLKQELPDTLHGLYEIMLTACMRRTVDKHHGVVGVLFNWLAFAFRPLVLDEVVSLLRHESGDDTLELDDIPEPMALFLRIGDPGRGSEPSQTSDVDYLLTGDVGNPVDQDGQLPVTYRQRAMRSFFCEAANTVKSEASRKLLIRPSEAHRRIFLVAARMSRLPSDPSPTTLNRGLSEYATLYLMDHWKEIDLSQHSSEERAEIMETLASVMSNKHCYATMAQSVGILYTRDFSDEVLLRIRSWAAEVSDDNGAHLRCLTPDAMSWWQRVAQQPESGLLELAKGHIQDLYNSRLLRNAMEAYDCAVAALLRSGYGDRILEQAARNFPALLDDTTTVTGRNGILGLVGLFDDLPMTMTAYWAIASLLLTNGFPGPARMTCERGLACDADATETFRLLYLAAQTELSMDHVEEAFDLISACLSRPNTGEIPQVSQRWARIVNARVEARRGNRKAAADAFAEARDSDEGSILPSNILDEEVTIYMDASDYTGLIDVLRRWSSTERLAWLTWDYYNTRHVVIDVHEAAAKAGQTEFLVKIYEEAVSQLDHFAAAAPLRCDLANVHLLVRGDAEGARLMLDEVLNSRSDGSVYQFTSEDPRIVLERAINLQSRVLRDIFVRSRDPAVKAALLEDARGLVDRPLAKDVSASSSTAMLYHDITVARMALQMGPRLEFQTRIQLVIRVCFDTLEDNVVWNDSSSLKLLSQALAHLHRAVGETKILRAARILLSAYFSALEPAESSDGGGSREESAEDAHLRGNCETAEFGGASSAQTADWKSDNGTDQLEEEAGGGGDGETESNEQETAVVVTLAPHIDDGDLSGSGYWCDGNSCKPRKLFTRWEEPLHFCIDCDEMGLCELCYAALQADDNGTAPFQGRRFCGRGHEHIKAPIEGWRGIKDGVMRIEGAEDVPFKEFLRSVREELCKEAWDKFWEG